MPYCPSETAFGLLESLVRIAHQFLARCFGARPRPYSGLRPSPGVAALHTPLDFAHGVAADLSVVAATAAISVPAH